MEKQGHAIWLFGLSGSGKSTLAAELQRAHGRTASSKVLMLDGDRLRAGLCRGLGFADADREENLRRAAEVARLGVESGLVVIAAFITPLEQYRRMIKSIVGESRLSLVYLAATIEVCRRRDPKGLYAGAAAGSVIRMSGIDSRFEAPLEVDLRLDTDVRNVADCVATLADFVCRRSLEMQ